MGWVETLSGGRLTVAERKSTSIAGMLHPSNWNVTNGPVSTAKMSAQQQFDLVESNPTAMICVDQIAAAASQVRFHVVNDQDEPIWDHPISLLLDEMDPYLGRSQTIHNMAVSLQVAGDAHVFKLNGVERFDARPTRRQTRSRRVPVPQTLEFLRPTLIHHDIDVETDRIRNYTYGSRNTLRTFLPEEVIHVRQPWPSLRHDGMSILRSATSQLIALNHIQQIQEELLDGGAIPPAILALEEDKDNPVGETQFQELVQYMREFRRGGDRSGQLLTLLGKYNLIETPRMTELISLAQIDHLDNRVANAFGYPPILLKAGEGVTYANQEQAELALWLRTVIPRILNPIASTFSQCFGLNISYDLSDTPVDRNEATNNLDRQDKVKDIATLNERRSMVGLPPIEGGDVIFRPAAQIPYGEDSQPINGVLEAQDREDQITQALEDYFGRDSRLLVAEPKQIGELTEYVTKSK